MSEQEEKVLNLCREWYCTAKDITMQTLWYEIGVMLENEPVVEQSVQADEAMRFCSKCGASYSKGKFAEHLNAEHPLRR